ncbi:SubName: Full=Uncharacterized protein {ECO:0000313/EMBL:CCA66561.1} [Serendipita indica DSM 11827]|nr:SubName: Full=Uncharacterized protein {ECO:0000313/EMBL:CCA66561.1} [Serendipita indica DSM 11827]
MFISRVKYSDFHPGFTKIFSQPSFRGFGSANDFENEGYSLSAPTVMIDRKCESSRNERAKVHNMPNNEEEPLMVPPSDVTTCLPSSAMHSTESSQRISNTEDMTVCLEAQIQAKFIPSSIEPETTIAPSAATAFQSAGDHDSYSQDHSRSDNLSFQADANKPSTFEPNEDLKRDEKRIENTVQQRTEIIMSDSEGADHSSSSTSDPQLFSNLRQESTILDETIEMPKTNDLPPSSPQMRMDTLSSPVCSPPHLTLYPLPMSDPIVLSGEYSRHTSDGIVDQVQEGIVTTHGSVEKEAPTYEASTILTRVAPNYPSTASLHRSKKKITQPFRSPLLLKRTNSKEGQNEHKSKVITPSARKTMVSKIKASGSAAARAAFKSPLRGDRSVTSEANQKQPRTFTANAKRSEIHQLEQRLQLLRRAVKIKQSGEDGELEVLVTKWRDIAKEVAWELWEIVKEGSVGDAQDSYAPTNREIRFGSRSTPFMRDDGFDRNWGWSEGEEKAGPGTEGNAETPLEEDTEQEKHPERTMGIMLKELGIADETLGWNEDEGDFVTV